MRTETLFLTSRLSYRSNYCCAFDRFFKTNVIPWWGNWPQIEERTPFFRYLCITLFRNHDTILVNLIDYEMSWSHFFWSQFMDFSAKLHQAAKAKVYGQRWRWGVLLLHRRHFWEQQYEHLPCLVFSFLQLYGFWKFEIRFLLHQAIAKLLFEEKRSAKAHLFTDT